MSAAGGFHLPGRSRTVVSAGAATDAPADPEVAAHHRDAPRVVVSAECVPPQTPPRRPKASGGIFRRWWWRSAHLLRHRGYSTIEIARRKNKSVGAVEYALRKMGWPRLAQSCPRKYDRRPVIRMVFDGYSLRDISRRLDVPYATVWRIAQTVR